MEGLTPLTDSAKKGKSLGLRLHIGAQEALSAGLALDLPEGAARHVQVLRLQPGDQVQLFDGAGQEWSAEIRRMGKRDVSVELIARLANHLELSARVTLAVGVPANDRMDTVIEKAAELGVAVIQPLMCERAVLRLDGERAIKKVAHWQAVAVSACEQSGRAWVPVVKPVASLRNWLAADDMQTLAGAKGVLSLRQARWVGDWLSTGLAEAQTGRAADGRPGWTFLSGPEGGLSEEEENQARQLGFTPVSLGPRTLRADTAPLTIMGLVSAQYPPEQ